MHLTGGDKVSGKLDMDWQTGTLSTSSRFNTVRFALDEITRLTLRAEYQTKAGSVRGSRIGCVYNARLDAHFGEEAVLLLATDSRLQDEDPAVEELSPFAEELASAHVELNRDEAVEQHPTRFTSAIIAAPNWMHAVFAGLVLLSALWVAWRAQLFH